MSDMKCPFCNSELHKDSDGYYTCYTDNCDCWANGGNGASGSESLWLTLIRTRKALDVAKDKLDTVRQYHRGTAVIRPDDIAAYCDRAIEQITALEQKE